MSGVRERDEREWEDRLRNVEESTLDGGKGREDSKDKEMKEGMV